MINDGRIIAEGAPVELKASLGATVVEIRVADPADVLDGRRTLAVKVPDKGPAVQEVIRVLDADAIIIESLAIREPTLDDVFLQLTGHAAGTGPEESSAQPTGTAASIKEIPHDHAHRTS